MNTSPQLQLLLTGNELMSGHTVDSNSAMIADWLNRRGIEVTRKVTIGDSFTGLVAELDLLSSACDVLIVNGGLGPTVDDLTAQAVAELIAEPLTEHPQALQHLEQWCEQRRVVLNAANRKQTQLPTSATIVPNPSGSAVGFSVEHQGCLIICTPGVPSELRLMMEDSVLETVAERFPGTDCLSTLRLQSFGLGESSLQQLLNSECPDWPKEVELGFRAGLPLLEVKLSTRQPHHSELQQQCYLRLQQLMGEFIIGPDDSTLATAVVEALAARGCQISCAESCTGGAIAAAITGVAGASAVFEAGFVTYSNSVKQQLVGVSDESLAADGAVSEAVAREMAEGAMARSGAQYAIAVTGIAGPGGGSDNKPVGTVWIAWGAAQTLRAHRFQLTGSRAHFQLMVTAISLDLMRRELLGIEGEPRYFSRY